MEKIIILIILFKIETTIIQAIIFEFENTKNNNWKLDYISFVELEKAIKIWLIAHP